MNVTPCPSNIAEIQGLYGPLNVLEIKIQQVWGLQQFQPGDWFSRSGKRLKIRSAGTWNRGMGPDFRDAVIELDGVVRVGDVEIHLYREDWWRHGHAGDPAYDNVILHAVLFAGGMERPVMSASGSEPEEWIMGPWMREDIESVSGGEPGLFGELVPELREWIDSDTPEGIRQRLLVGVDRRWESKESMARCLLETKGWKGALHCMLLYYLGFPRNRLPFYAMAEAFPPERWRDPAILDELKWRWRKAVSWNFGRPANRAEIRLKQFICLNREVPGWWDKARSRPSGAPAMARRQLLREMCWNLPTREVRIAAKLPLWRDWLRQSVLGSQFSASLADRLCIDVFLPLMVAGDQMTREEALMLWFHAYPAQYPKAYSGLLRLAGIGTGKRAVLCNGWIQGLIWMEDQLRLERIRSSTGDTKPVLSGSGA